MKKLLFILLLTGCATTPKYTEADKSLQGACKMVQKILKGETDLPKDIAPDGVIILYVDQDRSIEVTADTPDCNTLRMPK